VMVSLLIFQVFMKTRCYTNHRICHTIYWEEQSFEELLRKSRTLH
jgi:hypothetical protein